MKEENRELREHCVGIHTLTHTHIQIQTTLILSMRVLVVMPWCVSLLLTCFCLDLALARHAKSPLHRKEKIEKIQMQERRTKELLPLFLTTSVFVCVSLSFKSFSAQNKLSSSPFDHSLPSTRFCFWLKSPLSHHR